MKKRFAPLGFALLLLLATAFAVPALSAASETEPGLKEKALAFINPGLAYSLGYDHYMKGDYAKARSYWETAAQKDEPRAQYGLGLTYHLGLGVDVDYAKAHDWYAQAAASGNHEAEHGLGLLYMDGLGAPQNYFKALIYHKAAAEAGMTEASYSLGFMYYNGLGVGRDFKKAFQLFGQAAQSGNLRAMTALGIMYLHGMGTQRDYTRARELLQAVVDYDGPREPWHQPIPEAFANLGKIYHNGWDLAQPDYAKAVFYYLEAYNGGARYAVDSIIQVFEDLSDGELTATVWRVGELYEARMGSAAAEEAYVWYLVAKNRDHAGALQKLQQLTTRVSAAQRDAAAVKSQMYMLLLERR